ncbi:MAG: hypothetical protein WEA09_06600 [Gemmatimonadota bacterium]
MYQVGANDPVEMVVDPTALRGILTRYRTEGWAPARGFDKLLPYGHQHVAARLATDGHERAEEIWAFLCADGALPLILIFPDGRTLLDALDDQLLVQATDGLGVERVEVWTMQEGGDRIVREHQML